jgi:hypothetical protein
MMKPWVAYLLFTLAMLFVWGVAGLGFLSVVALLGGFGLDVFGLVMAFPIWLKVIFAALVVIVVILMLFIYPMVFVAGRANAAAEAMYHTPAEQEFDEVYHAQTSKYPKRSDNVE